MTIMDDHDEVLKAIRVKLKATRILFYSEIASTLEETFLYSVKLADHIGEISYTESLEAVRSFFNEEIDKLLTGTSKNKIKYDGGEKHD